MDTTTSEEAELAAEAYAFAYPLVTMEMTRRVMTNVEHAAGMSGPMGQLTKTRVYPDATLRTVAGPNADTLYTTAWLDLAEEPWVVTAPDSKGRYYLLPMVSSWTEVFSVPGTRTTGNGPQRYVISGPGWSGSIPEGFTHLQSPTAITWMLGRLYCSGTPEDYEAVHAMQDAIEIFPLSSLGTPYTPPPTVVDPAVDMETPVPAQVNNLDAQAYYTLFAELLKGNPPAAADAPMVESLSRIGIVPGQSFDWQQVPPAMQEALDAAIRPTQATMRANFPNLGRIENGWMIPLKVGTYGTDYLTRATIAVYGLAANLPVDSLYPTSKSEAEGTPYSGGDHSYVMHFEPGQFPPADAFWSMTMYDEQSFFVDNPLDRYAVGSRSEFAANDDGSVDVYIQKDSPGPDREANWLPAPNGPFMLMLRLYMPSSTPPSILDGTWQIPPVRRAP